VGNLLQFPQQGCIARLIDVVDGIAQVPARIEDLALDVDAAPRQRFVDAKSIPGTF
jgi:hypothetical protein